MAAALMAANGGQQSPQLANAGMLLANGKPFVPGPGGAPGVPMPAGAIDPQLHQQRIAAARAQMLAQQQAQVAAAGQEVSLDAQTDAQRRELFQLAQQNGFGTNIQGFLEARNRARLLSMAKLAAAQQAQLQAQQQHAQAQAQVHQVGVGQLPMQNGTNGIALANGVGVNGVAVPQQNGFPSPGMTTSQLQLKLPAHAAARLAGTAPPTPQTAQAQAQRS